MCNVYTCETNTTSTTTTTSSTTSTTTTTSSISISTVTIITIISRAAILSLLIRWTTLTIAIISGGVAAHWFCCSFAFSFLTLQVTLRRPLLELPLP